MIQLEDLPVIKKLRNIRRKELQYILICNIQMEIMFDVPTPIYNGLEVGDLINFKNWDSNVKLYGASMDQANNVFIITQTNKRPDGCEFFITEVSD